MSRDFPGSAPSGLICADSAVHETLRILGGILKTKSTITNIFGDANSGNYQKLS